MSLEESLETWITNCCYDLYGEEYDFQTKVVQLGSRLFGIEDGSTYEQILSLLDERFEQKIGKYLKSSNVAVLEGLLCSLELATDEDRQIFVGVIMEMEVGSRVHLMNSIKQNMVQYQFDDETEDEPIRTESTSVMCELCEEKLLTIRKVQHEVERIQKAAKELEQRLRAEISVEKNKLIDVELAVIDKSSQLNDKDSEIQELKKKLTNLDSLTKQNEKNVLDLSRLMDEIDILRPKAEKAENALIQNERLKSRLDELFNVQQQLKAESNAHIETHNKLLLAEQEVESLIKCRSQVEEYRTQYTEQLILTDELTLKLKNKDLELDQLKQLNSSLAGGQHDSLANTQQLMEELSAARERVRELESCGGIGEAMCEINPALMKEMNRLRSENVELASRLDRSSLDSLTSLEKSNEDLKAVNQSLQKKLMTTKEYLATAEARIVSLSEELLDVNQRFSAYRKEQQEAWKMHLSELTSVLREQSIKRQNLEEEHREKIQLMTQERVVLESRLADLSDSLSQCEDSLSQLREDHQTLTQNLHQSRADLASSIAQREVDHNTHSQELETIKANHDKKLRDTTTLFRKKMSEQEEQHATALAIESERTRTLESELCDEKTKRRQAERTKKFVESELHHTKTQLQASMSQGGSHSDQDVEALLKDYKLMQQQLTEVEKQRDQALRRMGTGLGVSGGGGGGGICVNCASSSSNSSHEDESTDRENLPPPPPPPSSSSSSSSSLSKPSQGSTLMGASRPLRKPLSSSSSSNILANSTSSSSSSLLKNRSTLLKSSSNSNSSSSSHSFHEEEALADKRFEQLMREKRELLAKSLEEKKDRSELSQKLLLNEKEMATMKKTITGLNLDKARLERTISKLQERVDLFSVK